MSATFFQRVYFLMGRGRHIGFAQFQGKGQAFGPCSKTMNYKLLAFNGKS